MRVSCPKCQTEYDVPDAALTGRTRKLRCVTCANQWVAGPIGGGPSQVETSTGPTAAELEYLQRPRAAPAGSMDFGPAATAVAQDFGQVYAAPAVSRAPEPPAVPDPAEARHQADRESFAALLEASRQSSSQNVELAGKKAGKAERKGPSPWLISALVLLLAVGMIFLERDHIMAAWPPSIRFFQALGLR